MSKQVQQFITRTYKQIKEDGLVQMSGVRFNRGDTPMTALRYFAVTNGITVSQAAAALNRISDLFIMSGTDPGDVFRKRRRNGVAPKTAKGAIRKFVDPISESV